MRNAAGVAKLIVVGLVLAVLGAALALAVRSSVAALDLPSSTIDAAAARAGAVVGPALPPARLLVVLVDGLGARAVWAAPQVANLGRSGRQLKLLHLAEEAWVSLQAEPPTFSLPQHVALLTGVAPLDSGVRTDLQPRRTELASVVDVVRARGGRAVQAGDGVDWGRLFAWDEALVVPTERVVDQATALFNDARNQLVLVHLTGIDQAGHEAGATSRRYQAAAQATGGRVAELARRWGGRGPLVVLSDHGHTARGGHGGAEPEVRGAFLGAVGLAVFSGARAEAAVVDVAPTLAALLGVPAPAQAQGRTILEILHLDPETAAGLRRADESRRAVVQALAARGRAAMVRAEGTERFERGLLAFVALVGATVCLRRWGPPAWRGLGRGAAAMALTAAAALILTRGRLSFSAFSSVAAMGAQIGLAGAAASALALARPLRAAVLGELPPGQAARLAYGFVVGASPAAMAALVVAGLCAPRFSSSPDWLAAGPTMAYAAVTPALVLACALPALALARRGGRARVR